MLSGDKLQGFEALCEGPRSESHYRSKKGSSSKGTKTQRIGRAHATLPRSSSAAARAVGSTMSAYGQPPLPPRAVPIWFGRIRLSLSNKGLVLALCGIVLVAVGLRAYALDYQSLWTDEIFSLMTTDPTLTFHQFWDLVLADTHPPIYYLVLRLSSAAFGQSEIAARVPSAFFGVLTVCGAAILPGSSLSRTSRLAFLLLLSISPGAVWYAREARSYALLLLLSTIITLACIRFLQCVPYEDRKARGAIVMLTAAAALASFTHYFGFLLATAAFLTCFILTNRRRRAIVVFAGSSVVASFVPWVLYHSQFISGDRAAWIGEFPVAASISWFEYLSFGGTASFVLFIGTAAVLAAIGGWRRLVAWKSTISACTLLCLLTLTAAVAISLHTPILTSRSMIVILPALYLIAAELTSCLVRRWGKVAGTTYLAAQIGLMGQPLLAYYTTEINEQWRDSAALVLHIPGCKSGAIHVHGDALNYHFFTKSVMPDLRLIDIPEGAAADLGNEPITSCPILLWVVGVSEWDLGDLLVRLGLSRSSLEVVEYHEAFVILRKHP
jgi:hypothetical protein